MVPPWETTRIVFQQATRGKGCSFCKLQFAVLAQIVFLGPNNLGSGFVGVIQHLLPCSCRVGLHHWAGLRVGEVVGLGDKPHFSAFTP